jgi:predicted secreted acid phosphatase
MNQETWGILLTIVIYLGIVLVIGFFLARKNESASDFYLGGRKLGPLVTAMSAEASDMSSYLLMGLPGLAYLSGMADVGWTVIGLGVGTYLNWLFTARRLRRYTQITNSFTLPQFFSNRFHDKKNILTAIASIMIIVFFVPYTASGFAACGKLFNSLFGMDYMLAMIISAVIIVGYTAAGGFLAASFTDFIQSNGCTALPGAIRFANHCVENGIALFYVTNRYDQGYKLSEEGYAGQEGYQKDDGTVIGSSSFDIFGKTTYDITMESMAKLGFPINDPNAANYNNNAILIVNDNKLNGSSKEWVRRGITEGGSMKTGERVQESTAYPETVDISSHHIAMLLGDDLNDISQIFSESENAVDRVALTIEHMDKWGTQWIVFPNAVYGSSANYASQYGFSELFDYFDYTNENSEAWKLYD